MKKILVLLVVIITLTGCSVERIDNYTFDKEMDRVLSLKLKNQNTIGKGYKYYLPRTMDRIKSIDYNDVLIQEDERYYLYVDVVGYYYKKTINYEVNNAAYYSNLLNYNGKKGYIEITNVDDKLLVEMFFNYAKIEVYTDSDNLRNVVSNCSYVLGTMKFNDSLLNELYEQGNLNAKEESYYLFNEGNSNDNFLDYVEEYDIYKEDSVNEETEIIQHEIETTTKDSSN